jgi:tetratricopeptide (TPR) repeat protein
MTRLIGTLLLLACAGATWAAGPPDAATLRRFGEIELASRLNQYGTALHQTGKLAEATKVFAAVRKMREGLYPKGRYPQGHPDLAQSLYNLAFLHQARGDYPKAEPLYRRAVEMREGLYPKENQPQARSPALQRNSVTKPRYVTERRVSFHFRVALQRALLLFTPRTGHSVSSRRISFHSRLRQSHGKFRHVRR